MSFDYEQSIWGRGYASLSPTVLASFRLKQSLKAVAALPAGANVLELGCGAGQFIRSVKRARPDLECHGSDISSRAIAMAKSVNDGVVYAVNGERLPYADASMDAVLIYDVLEHVDDVSAILREAYRVLKPGGFCMPMCRAKVIHCLCGTGADRCVSKGDLTKKYAGHINYFSRARLAKVYRDAGFSSVQFRYSEHVLGQLLGFVAFNLMDRAAKRQGVDQINGEEYFNSLNETTATPGLYKKLKDAVNSLVYFESWLLNVVPSPNVHSFVRK